jgi:hypothetical protein
MKKKISLKISLCFKLTKLTACPTRPIARSVRSDVADVKCGRSERC